MREILIYLARRAFTSASVCAKALIYQVRTISERETCQWIDKEKEMWGDVMIQGLGNQKAEAIIDVKINNTDADSYKYDTMAALLARWETIKKDNNGKNCHDQQIFFLCLSFLSTKC